MYKLIEKGVNIQEHEVPKTLFSWLIKFLYKSGFIIGWTIITAIFVTRFSVKSLPFLFLIQALLNISGMALFSLIGTRFSHKTLLIACSSIAGVLLLVASLLLEQLPYFFATLFLVFGFLMPQIGIFAAAYLEEFFSPLEGERISPVIESAETIGGIFAGILVAGLSMLMPAHKFFYVWAFFLLLMNCVILFLEPKHGHFQEHKSRGRSWKKFQHSIAEIQKIPFIQLVFCLLLIHWIIAYLLEFQYTSFVDEGAHGHEGNLAQGLASYHTLFHSSALIVQLFGASRILRKFGTAAGFIIHAFLTFLSASALLLGFGSFTTILAKNNFEISGILQKNGYEASYYALNSEKKQMVREVFEAFIIPLGTIIGTSILFLVQSFFLENHVNYALQMVLFSFSLLLVVLSLRVQNRYSSLVKNNLMEGEAHLLKSHAIEILSQKGHRKGFEILLKALHQKNQNDPIRLKILETMGKTGDIRSIPALLHFVHSPKSEIVLAALRALEIFPQLEQKTHQHAFSRYRIIQELKSLFIESKEEAIQMAVIRTLARFRDPDIVSFLLTIIQNPSPALQATGIKACAIFQDESSAHFLEPYLHSSHSLVKAQTLITLWQFKSYRPRIRSIVRKMLGSEQREEIIAACHAYGEIGTQEDKKRLIPFLTILDPEIRLQASLALFKLEYTEAGPYLVHLLLKENSVLFATIENTLRELSLKQKAQLKNLLLKEISRREQKSDLQLLTESYVKHIKKFFHLLEAGHEAHMLDQLKVTRLGAVLAENNP